MFRFIPRQTSPESWRGLAKYENEATIKLDKHRQELGEVSGLVEALLVPLSSHLMNLTAAVQRLQPGQAENRPFVPVEEKLLLTLSEVQALTGLSRETLRDAIKNEELPAKIIGKAWRIKRGDLEDYVENL
ncbi:MAG: helix-turn-helix domain-containing protein [Pleurocapsa sp. MO_226.B13]|nr:helix-turn-helix domain-containing protein [Pleurocapsa sp. MO_226.B13]